MTTTTVRFGLSLSNRAVLLGLPAEELLRAAELAEQSGYFDSIWVGDNLLSRPRVEALVSLAAIASRTRRVKLGTICLASFTQRDPLLVAIQTASLDVLSDGRMMLAVCLGKSAQAGPVYAQELENFRIKSNERVGRMIEGIELLRRFWTEDSVTHEGRFYTYREVDCQPKPVQANLPIIIAVNPLPTTAPEIVEKAFRRVARYADGWQTDAVQPPMFRQRWSQIRGYAAEYGRLDDVNDASLHLMVNINDDAEAAKRETLEYLGKYYAAGEVSPEKLDAWLASGPPAAVIDRIGQYLEAGCTTPALRFTSFNLLGQLQRCIDEVLPALKGATVSLP